MESYEIKKNILKGSKYLIVAYVNIYLNIVIIMLFILSFGKRTPVCIRYYSIDNFTMAGTDR